MAARLSFHFQPGDSLLHRWDSRCKLLAMLAVTFCMLFMSIPALGIFTLFLVLLLPAVGLSGLRLARDLRVWWILLVLIFLAQALFQKGEPFAEFPWLPMTREGVALGALACWRFVLVVGYGCIFMASTRHRDVGDALCWILSAVRIPAAALAFMASLTVRFLPLLLDASDAIREAGRARAIDLKLRPLRRARALVFPLMRNTLLRSEDLTLALAARGFDEQRTRGLPGLPPFLHVAALGVFSVTVIASLYLG